MPLNTAVVGGGVVSPVHLSGLKANPVVDLRAVCDADESRAASRASEYDVRAYGDFEGMLALEALDWIHLCTPVGTHAELARMALEDDLAVQIEAPLTDSAPRAEELSALVADREARVSVVHDGAFAPAILEATDRLREGAVGTLRAVDLLYAGEPGPDAVEGRDWVGDLPGGAFEERLARPISQVLGLGGYPESVDSITASATCRPAQAGEYAFDGTTFQYTTADGVHCSGTVVASDVPERVVRVHGDRGSMEIDLLDGTVTRRDGSRSDSIVSGALSTADAAVSRLRETASRALDTAQDPSEDGAEPAREAGDPRHEQIDREVRALTEDEPLPIPLSAGIWATHVRQAVRDAAATVDTRVSVTPEIDAA